MGDIESIKLESGEFNMSSIIAVITWCIVPALWMKAYVLVCGNLA